MLSAPGEPGEHRFLMVPREARVGVDLDRASFFTLLKAYFNAACACSTVKAYRTRHGFHLRLVFGAPVPPEKKLELRRALGDDPVRLALDEVRLVKNALSGFDTLFMIKRCAGGPRCAEEEFDPLAESWCSKAPFPRRPKTAGRSARRKAEKRKAGKRARRGF